jgi:hypothetical protein
MDTCHGGGRLDQDIRVLAGIPSGVHEIIQPTAKLFQSFPNERHCEHAILDA